MKDGKARELVDEFRLVVGGRGGWIDTFVPPLLFVLVNALWGLAAATWVALGVAGGIVVLRLLRGHSLLYGLGGALGVGFAVLVAWLLGRAEGYFLPAIAGSGLTALLCLVSVLVGRPLVAYSSYLARRWPLGWYWHPRVRPAYSEVTLAWAAFFAVRLVLQLTLFGQGASGTLAVVQVVSGWPVTVALLVASYLYGTWRLRNLGGPSVDEFRQQSEPPWTGQQRGF